MAGSDLSIELQAAAARGLGCCWTCGVSGVAMRSGSAPGAFCVCCCTRLEKFGECVLKCFRKIEPVRASLRAERAGRRCRAGAGVGGSCSVCPAAGPRLRASGAERAARAKAPRNPKARKVATS